MKTSFSRQPWIGLLAISLCCHLALAATPLFADVTLEASSLQNPPPGIRVGQGIALAKVDDHTGLRFQDDGIAVPLASNLSAASGTVSVSFQLPKQWPAETRGTLFHVGEQPHVHVTLFATNGRLNAVYKGGEEHYATITYAAAAHWLAGSTHDVMFCWHANGQSVEFFLEADGQLIGSQTGHLIGQWPQDGYVGARRRGQAWQGVLDRISLSPEFTAPRALRPGRRTITVDGDTGTGTGTGTCYNFWSVSNYTSQQMFANPAYAAQAREQKPYMKYVNCVRLLGGRHDGRNRWFRGVDEDGHVTSDFSGMIQYLRGIQTAGYTPRIVLDNIPTAMSEPGELAKYGNTRPAKDLKVWHEYVRQAVQAMVDAFGLKTVSQWRIRVGTEPDLNPGHWQGTKEQYLRHYDCTVDAVCAVIPDAEIGPGNMLNPATAEKSRAAGRDQWGLDIVDHCATGTNFWTGAVGTRICFLECSWYGQVGRSVDSLDLAIERMRARLGRYPKLAKLPISIAEFAVLQDEHGHRLFSGDITEWGASWYAAIADRVYDLNVQQVHEWAETTAGIPHPRTLVIGMLEQMEGGRRLPTKVTADSAARAGAIVCDKNGTYYVMLYNHRSWRAPSIPEQIDLVLKASRLRDGGSWTVSQWGIDKDHGVFAHQLYADCAAAGIQPLPDSPLYGGNVALRFGQPVHKILAENRSIHAGLAKPVELQHAVPLTINDDTARLTVNMPGHSVRLLVIIRRPTD